MNRTRIIILIFLLPILIFCGYKYFYNRELFDIQNKLNAIENVEVKEIWGHEDLSLEEISARVFVRNKGEIVLYGLSKDCFSYPENVYVSEINNYSFKNYTCKDKLNYSSEINIGKNTQLGKLIGVEFRSAEDVIRNYDRISDVLKNLKTSPQINHFSNLVSEEYLLIKNSKSKDLDPIFSLYGVENEFDFARKLKWKNSQCK